MFPRVAGPRRFKRLDLGLAVVVLWIFVLSVCIPYDNSVRLLARFATHKVLSFFRSPFDEEAWLRALGEHPVDLAEDVALIIKSGYGTQARILAQFDAAGLKKTAEKGNGTILVIGDFAAELKHDGGKVHVYDMVEAAVSRTSVDMVVTNKAIEDRLEKYRDMTKAIESGRAADAEVLANKAGWELDAMKFIPGLELAWRRMPGKKWYVLQDDDTYIIRPSLKMILDRLDPSRPLYIGNSIGDYKARFAHGGSGIVLSRAAMSRLFDQHPEVVRDAYKNSLTEVWGDKLVATTFLKVGVYIEERYGRYFNGEYPTITRIQPDRFCSPLVSFHGLKDPKIMREVGQKFIRYTRPVVWKHLWEMYHQPEMEQFEKKPVRSGWDHVGRTDEHTMTEHVSSAEGCAAICERHSGSCLAWTWTEEKKTCHRSPWVIVGERAKGKYTGLNVPRVSTLMDECV